MQFNPPLIRNIEEVLPYIEGNPAFIVVDKGWYKVIDYVYTHRDTFTNDYARECRGLKFCSETGNIIARPYHKFHNLGECAGYHDSDCDLSQPHHVLDKLDGSMVHTVIDPWGRVRLMTRMGESKQALDAFAFLTQIPEGLNVVTLARLNPTKTFIFEYVGPNNRIVIPYEREQLILTGIRDMFTGAYDTYMGMMAHLGLLNRGGEQGNLSIVGTYAPTLNRDFIASDTEKEGAIVRFETGAMVKIKSDIYCRKHKSKELTETNKGVVQIIIDGNLDDVLPMLEQKAADALDDYSGDLLYRINELHEGIRHILSLGKHLDQKTFALSVQATYGKNMQKLLFMTRKSGDGRAELIKLIKSRYNKEADLVELFKDLDIPLWV